eukprot:Seg1006.4 transcript_id=Seg1006.4/GoldUCD/mRNA.D3Y31 product="hypothetical protein" protein_id=Seg1006.4/GoldUCD/D3Y31
MKTFASRTSFLSLLIVAAMELFRAADSSSCNPAVLKLYGWCEQWTCADNCTCTERQDCRQYCDGHMCKDMRCLSPSICKQKVHLNGRIRPRVLNMFARAPFVTQDCTSGICQVMRAKGPKRYKDSKSGGAKSRRGKKRNYRIRQRAAIQQERNQAALQNCVGGVCQRLVSNLKITKQFCSDCAKMHCMGSNAKNCTQICTIGACRQVQCDADDCQQACLQNSTCTLKCGKNVETCLQVCEEGSHCMMFCNAKHCRQICRAKKGCHIFRNNVPRRNAFKTTEVSPLNTTSITNLLYYTTATHTELAAITTRYNTRELSTVSKTKQKTVPENYIKDGVNKSEDNSVGETKTANLSVGNSSTKSFVLDVRILSFVISVALIFVSRIV